MTTLIETTIGDRDRHSIAGEGERRFRASGCADARGERS